MKKLFIIIIFTILAIQAKSQNPFISTWQVNFPQTITIPTTGTGYNYSVDWGDGTITNGHTGDASHNYMGVGAFQISISGDFPRIYMVDADDRDKIREINQWGDIQWESMHNAFWRCENLNAINATDSPDLSNVTDLSGMFEQCYALTGGLDDWDVSSITNMKDMFKFAINFNDTLENWNVTHVISMEGMFQQCQRFNKNIGQWDVGRVENFNFMFSNAHDFNQNIGQWDVSSATTMESMFGGGAHENFFNQDISQWDVSNVTNMRYMFKDNFDFNQDIGQWDVSSVLDMGGMFFNTIFNQDIGQWDVSNVTIMGAMFRSSRFNQDIGQWDVSNVTNMGEMFYGDFNSSIPGFIGWFNQDISEWDVSAVTNMERMFYYALSFNQNIGDWDISGVTNMHFMLTGSGIDKINYDKLLNGWSIKNVQDDVVFGVHNLEYCNGASSRNNLINNYNWIIQGDSLNCTSSPGPFVTTWKTDNPGSSCSTCVTIKTTSSTNNYDIDWESDGTIDEFNVTGNITHDYGTFGVYQISIYGDLKRVHFQGSDHQKLLSIDQWGSIEWGETMESAFWGCVNMNILATDSPDFSLTTNLNTMFAYCSSLNNDLSNWDVSQVTSLQGMLFNATSFNQDLSNWNISSVSNMAFMLDGTSIDKANYDNTLIGWASQNVQSNVNLGASGLEYCNGEAARNNLINNYGWSISGDILSCIEPSPSSFITTWNPSLPGSSNANSITIQTFPGETYNYNVDWDNDGTFDEFGITGDVTHSFGTSGLHTIAIEGDFPRMYLNNSGDRSKLISIDQWGDIVWTSMEGAFHGAENLITLPIDTPDLSQVTSLKSMFSFCLILNGPVNHWDVSTITDMDNLFATAQQFNSPMNDWNTSNVTTLYRTFHGAINFNQSLNNWDVSNVTSIIEMFRFAVAYNQDMNNWNTTNLQNTSGMFENALAFNGDISTWNVSQVHSMSKMFQNATSFNQDISVWNTSNTTRMENMFSDASSFDQNIGSWDMSNVDRLFGMMDRSGLSIDNYDLLLNGWAGQTLQAGEFFGAEGLEYCNGITGRNILLNTFNWSINGDIDVCTFPPCGIPDLLVFLDSMGNATIDTSHLDYHFPANADSIYLLTTDFHCGPFQNTNILVTITGLDTVKCSFKVETRDTIAPLLICKPDTAYLDHSGIADAFSYKTVSFISEPCGINDNNVKPSFSCADIGDNIVTYTVWDGSGNTSSCSEIVTVLDTISPVVTCQNISTDLTIGGIANISPIPLISQSSDNCTIDTMYVDQEILSCQNPGSNSILVTVKDSSGNSATCISDVIVTDTHGYCCPDGLNVNYNPIEATDYYAADSIYSKGQIGNQTSVNFRSTIVKIDTSFQVDQGGMFQVINEDCSNN